MAKKLDLSDTELKEKFLPIIDYIIETSCSLRKAVEYAKENAFVISHVTLSNFITNKLEKIDPIRYLQVKEILEKNKPKSIEDPKVKHRIYSALYYFLEKDLTVEEIAQKLNSTKNTIYNDLTFRLIKMDEIAAKKVKKKLEEHRKLNIDKEDKNKNLNISQWNNNLTEEIILIMLTYRVSYNSMAKMLKVSVDDLKEKLDYFRSSFYQVFLYRLDLETANESSYEEQIAYINAYNYLKTRRLILKKIKMAKKEHDQTKLDLFQKELKNHLKLIDDTIVSQTVNKPLSALTNEEKIAIANYRLKYAQSLSKCAQALSRDRKTIKKLEEEYAETNPLFRKKIEELNDYWQGKSQETISKR